MPRERGDPPRWFLPALAAGMLLAVAALGILLSPDSTRPAEESLVIGEQRYSIPATHISSLNREPHIFFRLRHPEGSFDLIYDSRAENSRDAAGVPRLFSINDQDYPDIKYHRLNGALLVCRRASTPISGCGTWIRHGSATWAVLFPESRIAEAESYVARAAASLRSYEARAAENSPTEAARFGPWSKP